MRLAVGLASVGLLAGCSAPPIEIKPITRPADFVPHWVVDPGQGGVFAANTAIGGGRMTVRVLSDADQHPLVGAQVTLAGPTPAAALTVSNLDLTLQPLEPGTYSVRVAADGFVPKVVADVAMLAQQPTWLSVELTPSAGTVSGRATGEGKALEGVRVALGEAYALSDAQGRFSLDGVGAGPSTLSLTKTGYEPLTRALTGPQALDDLSMTPKVPVLSFDNAAQVLATVPGTPSVWVAMSALRGLLVGDGMTVANASAQADVRVLVCPEPSWAAGVAPGGQRYERYVADGGKLVVMGEWGGFEGFDPRTLNTLLQPFGMALWPDQVRLSNASASIWPLLTEVSARLPRPVPIPDGVRVFDAASVFAPAPAFGVLSTGSAGYRIAAVLAGDWAVVAARPYGRGLVVVVGDTSAWIQPASVASRSSNLEEASNAAFMRDLLRW